MTDIRVVLYRSADNRGVELTADAYFTVASDTGSLTVEIRDGRLLVRRVARGGGEHRLTIRPVTANQVEIEI